MKKCCVIGSINADLVITLPRFHRGGETIAGSGFQIFPGGKGANQAVALSRLGAEVAMVGGIGADANGEMYLEVLKREGVDARMVHRFDGETTGVALIEVESVSGENRIAISAGAMLVDGAGARHMKGFCVDAVDTTAAGDSFNAGFACALAEGMAPEDAVRFANAVGALATTRMGAQSGMPTRAQVEELMTAAS